MTRLLYYLNRNPQQIVFIICMIIFVFSSITALQTGDSLRYPDEIDYNLLAKQLATNHGYVNKEMQSTAFRPPGYPLILSILYRLWSRPLAAKLMNAFILACIGWLLAEIVAVEVPAGKIFAPLLILMYPVYLYTAATLYPQIFGTLLIVAIVFFLLRCPHARFTAPSCGIVFGLLILAIPYFILFLPVVATILFFNCRRDLGKAFISTALFVACSILTVSPWTIRNAIVFKTFIPVSTNSGVNLLLGNSENTGPNTGVNVDINHYLNETEGMDEAQADKHLRRRAYEWIINNPGQAAKLYIRKFINHFNYRNKLAVQSEASLGKDMIMYLSYYPLLLAGVIRCLLWRRYRFSSTEFICYAIYICNAFLSALFFTRIRLRLPFDAFLIAINAIFIGRILSEKTCTILRSDR